MSEYVNIGFKTIELNSLDNNQTIEIRSQIEKKYDDLNKNSKINNLIKFLSIDDVPTTRTQLNMCVGTYGIIATAMLLYYYINKLNIYFDEYVKILQLLNTIFDNISIVIVEDIDSNNYYCASRKFIRDMIEIGNILDN